MSHRQRPRAPRVPARVRPRSRPRSFVRSRYEHMDTGFAEVPVRIGERTYTLQIRRRDDYVNANALSKQAGPAFNKYVKVAAGIPFPLDPRLYEEDVSRFGQALDPRAAVRLVGERSGLRTGLHGSGFELWTPGSRQMVVEKMACSPTTQTTWVHPLIARHVAAWLFPSEGGAVRAAFDRLRLREGLLRAGVCALPAPSRSAPAPETRLIAYGPLGESGPPGLGDVVTTDEVAGIHQDFIVDPHFCWLPMDAPAQAQAPMAPTVPTTAAGHATKFVRSLVADDGTPLDFEVRADGYVNGSRLEKSANLRVREYINKTGVLRYLDILSREHGRPTGVYTDTDGEVKVLGRHQVSHHENPSTARRGNPRVEYRTPQNPAGGDRHEVIPLIQKIDDMPIAQRAIWVHGKIAADMAQSCSVRVKEAILDVADRYARGQVTTEESRAVAEIAAGGRRRTPCFGGFEMILHNQRTRQLQMQPHLEGGQTRRTDPRVGAKRPRAACA
ncbi:hypothetical protein WJX84_000439 [Apatococcus fuscideae]|uniref:Uncharacterized protein n=1 Tax=Apatococcus fuscideae TaxID=2026836 RepID=A0AAW1T893_9CHLO